MAKRMKSNYEKRVTRQKIRRAHPEHCKASEEDRDRRRAKAEYLRKVERYERERAIDYAC